MIAMSTEGVVCRVYDIDPDIDAAVERAMSPTTGSFYSIMDGRVLREMDQLVRPKRNWENIHTAHTIDDEPALARLIDNQEPAWYVHTRKVGLAKGRHPIAWMAWTEDRTLLTLQCPSCRARFMPIRKGTRWECACPSCVQDACSAEDGRMPPMGEGATALEAAQNWSEDL